MKKKLIYIVIICILALSLIIAALFFFPKTYDIELHQPRENIAGIRLIKPYASFTEQLIYKLEPDEIDPFLDSLTEIKAKKYHFKPSGMLGNLAVEIIYEDGSVQYIGEYGIACYDSITSVTEPHSDSWYYLGHNALFDLFSQYVDSELLSPSFKYTP